MFLTTAALVAAVVVFATGPADPHVVSIPASSPRGTSVRGAVHIHTTRSDGALSKRQVAAAAAHAGLDFAVFTDHGSGVPPPDPPEYIDGVLCIDGVEISTTDGHYIGIGIAEPPYPLGGDGDAVAEDVARLGGFGFIAHPVSARAELEWWNWDAPFDGIEWLNADSEWRDEGWPRLSRALIDYLWRPPGALAGLLDRPVGALRRWDDTTVARQVVGLAGHDAHGGLGAETGDARGRRVHVPSYEASFRTFSNYVSLSRPLGRDAAVDAMAVVEAFRSGAVFTAIDAIASPADLQFSASVREAPVTMGESLPTGSGPARFSIRAAVPPGAVTALLRDGRAVAQAGGGALEHESSLPGAYRVEVNVPSSPGRPPVPWLVSNPIYRFDSAPANAAVPQAAPLPTTMSTWRIESDPGSTGTLALDPSGGTMTFALKGESRSSQFVALAVDVRDAPDTANAVVVRASAIRPMRVSMQLRFARDQDGRWGRSVFVDSEARELVVPFAKLRHLGSNHIPHQPHQRVPMPAADRVTSLLFVVDLTNAEPGAGGSLTLSGVALARIP